MAREVYTDKEFIKFSKNHIFMRVFQDTDPQGKRLADKFEIDGVPTLIVLDSSGREVDRIIGAMSAPELIDELGMIFESAKHNRKYSI